MNRLITIVCLLLILISIFGCSDEQDDFGDYIFIGTWDVQVSVSFSQAGGPFSITSEYSCVFDIRGDGTLNKSCNGKTTHFKWFYRQSPKVIVFVEDSAVFPIIEEYRIETQHDDYQVWSIEWMNATTGPDGEEITSIQRMEYILNRR